MVSVIFRPSVYYFTQGQCCIFNALGESGFRGCFILFWKLHNWAFLKVQTRITFSVLLCIRMTKHPHPQWALAAKFASNYWTKLRIFWVTYNRIIVVVLDLLVLLVIINGPIQFKDTISPGIGNFEIVRSLYLSLQWKFHYYQGDIHILNLPPGMVLVAYLEHISICAVNII